MKSCIRLGIASVSTRSANSLNFASAGQKPLGYQFISVGADVLALGEMFRRVARAFAEIGS